MGKRMKAYVIGEAPESDREVSGIRSRPSVPIERQTAKVPKVDLDRLIAEQRALADDDDEDTIVAPPESVTGPHSCIPASEDPPESQETTVKLQAPDLPPDLPSPLGSDFPPAIAELTAVMKFTPVPIPPPSLPPFEAMREARDDARRTQRLVVAIWAFALTLAGSLGYFVATHS